MSAILRRLFGSKKQTGAALEAEIRRQEVALAEARARVEAAARDRASALDVLDKAAVRAADALKLDAAADVEIAERALAALREASADRQKVEAREALETRAEAARRLVAVDAAKLLDRYDAAAAEVAATAAAFDEIDAKIREINAALQEAGLPPIANATDTHRAAPDEHTPERREMRTKWFCRRGGHEVEIGIFGFDDKGNRVPQDGHGNVIADAYERKIEVIVREAQTRSGDRLPSFRTALSLPAARVGAKKHWVTWEDE